MKTPELYCRYVNECNAAAGRSDSGWNQRFIVALSERGLMLFAHPASSASGYPDGMAYAAPHCVSYTPGGWCPDTYIVWKP